MLRVIPQGETVTAIAQSENDLRSVVWGQYGRWIYEDYLASIARNGRHESAALDIGATVLIAGRAELFAHTVDRFGR